MSLLVLFESSVGYCLFEVDGYEEIQQKVNNSNIRVKNSKTPSLILKKYLKSFL
jgi:hypothetical protein